VQGRRAVVRCKPRALGAFARRLLVAAGVPAAHARLVAHSLVTANLRGVDSHGIQLIGSYLRQLQAGGMDPQHAGSVVAESGGCLVYDGHNGLGQVIADRCTDHALRLAHDHGLALVTARNANHFGAAGYWADKIVRAGSIGLVLCNACPIVPPWQGKSARFGTNPFCAAVPTSGPLPWMLDMATTTVALGKLSDAAFRGQRSIPESWGFLTAEGFPTTDTREAQAGQPTPFGTYKGSGLAMLVEMLTAGLSGGPMATEITPFGKGAAPLQISHSYLVIDPARFLGGGEYARRMERLTQMIKSSEPAAGYDEVLVAGEPECRQARERKREGIPIPFALWRQLGELAAALKVAGPAGPRLPGRPRARKTKASLAPTGRPQGRP
jgi:LDH2 family malate/lactate/ureidoglycolate dehydrogenase